MLRTLAGYRNRMVHFYDEISRDELYEIARASLGDIRKIISVLADWVESHPDWAQDDL